jgi:hypothetical protein
VYCRIADIPEDLNENSVENVRKKPLTNQRGDLKYKVKDAL